MCHCAGVIFTLLGVNKPIYFLEWYSLIHEWVFNRVTLILWLDLKFKQNNPFVQFENATFIIWNVLRDVYYGNEKRFAIFSSCDTVTFGWLLIPLRRLKERLNSTSSCCSLFVIWRRQLGCHERQPWSKKVRETVMRNMKKKTVGLLCPESSNIGDKSNSHSPVSPLDLHDCYRSSMYLALLIFGIRYSRTTRLHL